MIMVTYKRIKETSSDLIIPNYHLSDVSDYSMNDIWFFIDVVVQFLTRI